MSTFHEAKICQNYFRESPSYRLGVPELVWLKQPVTAVGRYNRNPYKQHASSSLLLKTKFAGAEDVKYCQDLISE